MKDKGCITIKTIFLGINDCSLSLLCFFLYLISQLLLYLRFFLLGCHSHFGIAVTGKRVSFPIWCTWDKKKKFTKYKNSCKYFVPWLLSQLFYNNMYHRKIQIPSIQYWSKSKWVTLCTFLKLTLCFKHKHLHVGDNKRECQPLGYQYSDIGFCICIIIVCFNDKTMLSIY